MPVNIDDFRTAARKRLPRALFDYIDGGSDDERTLRANQADFARYTFRPRTLIDVEARDQRTTVLGQAIASPLILAPTGFTGVFWPNAEVCAARAAAKAGIPFTLSTMSINSIEQVAREASGGLRWFQLYVWRDREVVRGLIERAQAAGFKALVITVDTPVLGHREKDSRSGLTLPPRITASNVLDTLPRLSWLKGLLSHPRPTFGNFVGTTAGGQDAISLASYTTRQFSPSITWRDLAWFRSVWNGPIAIKGVLDAGDARLAVEHGLDAVIVSNHGGRQLDSAPSPISVLGEIVDAVHGDIEVILDGGIRRGSDVVKAIALGAKACMMGKAFNYAVSAAGQPGVEQAIGMLQAEIDRTLALIGRPRLADLDRSAVRYRGGE